MTQREDLQRILDSMTPAQAERIAEASDLLEPPDDVQIPRVRSMAMRIRYARAAFVGDVRLPFLVFIALAAIFFSGWFFAHVYYADWVESEKQRIRAETAVDSIFELRKHFGRVRPTLEENEQFLKFSKEFGRLIQEAEKAALKELQQTDRPHDDQ